MKKCFLVLIVLFAVAGVSFAAEGVSVVSGASSAYYDVSMMLNSKLTEKRILMIQSAAVNLTPAERSMLYMTNEKSSTNAFLWNLFAGSGVGSFIQGDIAHGLLFVGMDLTAIGLMYAGIVETFGDLNKIETSSPEELSELAKQIDSKVWVGAALSLVSRIWQLVQPGIYAKNYNAKLAKALSVSNFGAAVLPNFDVAGNVNGTTLAVGFSF